MATLTTGTDNGALEIDVDPYGAFGSGVGDIADDALYDPVEDDDGDLDEAGTTIASGVAIRIGDTGERTFLTTGAIGEFGNLDDPGFDTESDTQATSSFDFSSGIDNLDIDLQQVVDTVLDSDGETIGSVLTQIYTLSNPEARELDVELVRYIDPALQFDGSSGIDGGGLRQLGGVETLLATDTTADTLFSPGLLRVTATGGSSPDTGRFAIDTPDRLQGAIASGARFDEEIQQDGVEIDANGDGLVDEGFDTALALSTEFTLAPGASAVYVTTTQFGALTSNLIAFDEEVETEVEQPVTVEVLANDQDSEDESISLTGFDGTSEEGGSVIRDDNGTPGNATDDRLIYTPPAGFSGTDSFTYEIESDDDTAIGQVTVSVVDPSFSIDPSPSALELAEQLLGESATILDATLTTGSANASGTFSGGTQAGLALDTGIILSTGEVATAIGPNDRSNAGSELNTAGDSDLDALLSEGQTAEAAVLEVTFTTDESELNFEYLLASEEYNEFVDEGFSDIFGLFVNDENIAFVPGDVAPVAVDSINNSSSSGFFVDNEDEDDSDIQFDGFTTLLLAQAAIAPGNPQRLKLAIGDVGDAFLDSAVFVGASAPSTVSAEPVDAGLTEAPNEILQIVPDDPSAPIGQVFVEFSLESVASDRFNEILVFEVEDEIGTVNGRAPGDSDYPSTVLGGAQVGGTTQVLFSTFSDPLLAGDELSRTLQFDSDARLGFALLTNATLDAQQAGTQTAGQVFFSFPAANFDNSPHVEVTSVGAGEFRIDFEDALVGRGLDDEGFGDVVLRSRIVEERPRGSSVQGQIQSQILDFRDSEALQAGESWRLQVAGEAVFFNTVGFYEVTNTAGSLFDEISGEILTPGSVGYAAAAVRQRIATIDTNGQVVSRIGSDIDPTSIDGLYAPFIVANGTPETFLAQNSQNAGIGEPVAYFNYFDANPDFSEHLRLLGDNRFGFEDLPGGGDRDFNDMIVEVSVI